MIRGGVFVGVDRTTGGLPILKAAATGAEDMYEWAVAADLGGMSPRNARLITDSGGSIVSPQQIVDAVQEVIDSGVDQLILYFSGHGVIVDNSETWLLSKAPTQGSAAISVFMSALDARSGWTPHVVIISDACRTPAKDLQGQRITAVSAFPNVVVPGPQKRVDVFYACTAGQAAIEFNTANAWGIYTHYLHEALVGHVPSVLAPARATGDPARYLWPGPLAMYLDQAVGEELQKRNIDKDQTPAFDIQYGEANLHWLARFEPRLGDLDADLDLKGLAPPVSRGGRRQVIGTSRTEEHIAAHQARTVGQLADALLHGIVEDRGMSFAAQLRRAADAPAPGARDFIAAVGTMVDAFNVPSSDRTTVVRVRGTSLTSVRSADPSVASASGDRVTRTAPDAENASAVVGFANSTVAALPILTGFTTDVLASGREIISIMLEPNTVAPDKLEAAALIRQVRAVVAASVRHGRLAIAHDGLRAVRRLADGLVDPTTALYACYASYILGAEETATDAFDELRDAGVDLFDVAMLAGHLTPQLRDAPQHRQPRPFLPLLSQGWQLLGTFGLADAEPLATLKNSLLPSLWTVFPADATGALLDAEVLHR